jgi:hypothetical protein
MAQSAENVTSPGRINTPAKDSVPVAASVTISNGASQEIIGEMLVTDSGAIGAFPTINIIRKLLPNEQKRAKELGIEEGSAYLIKALGDWRFLRKVDLSKSNEELAAEFGVKKK